MRRSRRRADRLSACCARATATSARRQATTHRVRTRRLISARSRSLSWRLIVTTRTIIASLASHDGFQLLNNRVRGRNSALIDPSAWDIVRGFGNRHPEEILPLVQEGRRRISRSHIRHRQRADVDVSIIGRPAEPFKRVVEVEHHVGSVHATSRVKNVRSLSDEGFEGPIRRTAMMSITTL